MSGKNYDNILQQSSQRFLFSYDDWSDVVRMEKLNIFDNAQPLFFKLYFPDFVNYLETLMTLTKINKFVDDIS